MGLLTADNPRDTALAWLFVTVQFVFLLVIVVLSPGGAWALPKWLDTAAFGLQIVGAAVLVVAGREPRPLRCHTTQVDPFGPCREHDELEHQPEQEEVRESGDEEADHRRVVSAAVS